MSQKEILKPSNLKLLTQFKNCQKNYEVKHFIGHERFASKILLEDKRTNEECIGKVVAEFNPGEFCYWPKLKHTKIQPLLEIISLQNQLFIFISPLFEKSLKVLIKEPSFRSHPKCFERRKAYAKDVLSALQYIHRSSLGLLNLCVENIVVCSQSDRAIVCELSATTGKNEIIPNDIVCQLSIKPPELQQHRKVIDNSAVDMWCYGVLVLQIFTNFDINYEREEEFVKKLNIKLLQRQNIESNLAYDEVEELKLLLELCFAEDPKLRITAKKALKSPFFNNSTAFRLDETARWFWTHNDTLISFLNGPEDTQNNKTRQVRTIWKNDWQKSSRKSFKNILTVNNFEQNKCGQIALSETSFFMKSSDRQSNRTAATIANYNSDKKNNSKLKNITRKSDKLTLTRSIGVGSFLLNSKCTINQDCRCFDSSYTDSESLKSSLLSVASLPLEIIDSAEGKLPTNDVLPVWKPVTASENWSKASKLKTNSETNSLWKPLAASDNWSKTSKLKTNSETLDCNATLAHTSDIEVTGILLKGKRSIFKKRTTRNSKKHSTSETPMLTLSSIDCNSVVSRLSKKKSKPWYKKTSKFWKMLHCGSCRR